MGERNIWKKEKKAFSNFCSPSHIQNYKKKTTCANSYKDALTLGD